MSVRQLVTAEQLWDMPNPSDRRRELIDGEVVEMSPTTLVHGVIVGEIYEAIKACARKQHLGVVGAGDVGYVLRRDPELVRAPDVSFVAREKIPESGLPERGFWDGPPTLAVEVVSPDDRATDVRTRVQDFLRAGTRQVWVLWPQQQSVTVHTPDGTARELSPEAQIDGGDVLPGFSVRVGELFRIRP